MDQLKDILGAGFGEKVLDYMKELAKGLGIAADHVYEVLVKQQIAFGIASMIGWVIGMLVLSILLKQIPNWYKSSQDDHIKRFGYKDSDISWGYGLLSFFILAGIGGCLSGMFYGFMHVFNPEYYAIQEIVGAITGK